MCYEFIYTLTTIITLSINPLMLNTCKLFETGNSDFSIKLFVFAV